MLFAPESGRLLGAQAVGEGGVEKRIDVMAMAIQKGATVFDLEEAELCYAPQYGSGQGPGEHGRLRGGQRAPRRRAASATGRSGKSGRRPATAPLTLDVRPPTDVAAGAIPGTIRIPLGELRARLDELPRDREIWVHCGVGPDLLLRRPAAQAARLQGPQSLRRDYVVSDGRIDWRLAGSVENTGNRRCGIRRRTQQGQALLMPALPWSKADCPVGFREKAWVETSCAAEWRSSGQGGLPLHGGAAHRRVLPRPDRRHVGSRPGLLDRVCRYMDVQSAWFQLRLEPDDLVAADAVGRCEPGQIVVAETEAAEPTLLMARLGHEVAHEMFRRRQLLVGELDRELAVALATVPFGFGIFTANATIIDMQLQHGRPELAVNGQARPIAVQNYRIRDGNSMLAVRRRKARMAGTLASRCCRGA